MSNVFDIIDGKRVPPTILTSDTIIDGVHQGTVRVERGILTISGELHGSLNVQRGTKVLIIGKQHGTVNVEENALVTVNGELNGTTNVAYGGTIKVEDTGRLAGSLNNQGTVIVQGVFGGAHSGNDVILVGNGYIKQPIMKDGISYYSW